MLPQSSSVLTSALVICLMLVTGAANASDIVVKVSGISGQRGQVGCSLFESSPAFPMDNTGTRQIWLSADPKGVMCKFSDVAPGTYAVAVAHDLNDNKKVDTNFLGIPTEGWAVSNNVVPSLRAPRFDEAKFAVKEAASVELAVKLVY